MMNQNKTKILYSSPEAARVKTVTGWVSSDGRFFGKDEHMARYVGSTHRLCECGTEIQISYLRCDDCQDKIRDSKYAAMPHQEWDGIQAVCLNRDDKYFFSADEVEEYLSELEEESDADSIPFNREEAIAGLDLVLCEPNYLRQLDFEGDDFPEDQTEEDVCTKELLAKLHELNELVRSHPPISYSPGKYRTTYKPKA